jgi:hypothetical protein
MTSLEVRTLAWRLTCRDRRQAAVSDPVANVRYAASATGDAMGNDQQGIPYERIRGTAWYARVCFSYGKS